MTAGLTVVKELQLRQKLADICEFDVTRVLKKKEERTEKFAALGMNGQSK